jgi:hypothetical protein
VNDRVVKALLDNLDTQIEILRVQSASLRQRLESTEDPPRVEIELPERCSGQPEHRCGLLDDAARIPCGNLTEPGKWQCRGCREVTIDGLNEIAAQS